MIFCNVSCAATLYLSMLSLRLCFNEFSIQETKMYVFYEWMVFFTLLKKYSNDQKFIAIYITKMFAFGI